MSITKIKKEPKVSASSVSVSPGQQLDAALTAMSALIDTKAGITDVATITGSRTDLDTTDKTNLVAAINEVNNKVNTDNDYNNLTNKPIEKTEDDGYVVVAFGNNRTNQATAQNAFAEGGKTEANGDSSHAEGFSTEANGNSSHAEGQTSMANGVASHAEGFSAWALGAYSHAEGNETETTGQSSHAEGKSTIAYGASSHAEGEGLWSNRIVSRAYTAGISFIYVKREVKPGYVISDDAQEIGVQSCTYQESGEDYKLSLDTPFTEDIAVDTVLSVCPSAYGDSSHVEGKISAAKGEVSHAEGYTTYAVGDYSHAEGFNTTAQGSSSHAEGFGTITTNTAEHASGQWNKSTGLKTIYSVGIGTADNARVNLIEGTLDGKFYVKGIGNYDGTNVNATGVKALGEAGWISISYDDISDAPVKVSEEGGYAIGDTTCAMAQRAFAEGGGTYAVGENSHAEGAIVNPGRNYVQFGYTAGSFTIRLEYLAKVGEILIADNQVAIIQSVTEENTYWTAYLSKPFTIDMEDGDEVLVRTGATGSSSHAEGTNCLAAGDSSHAEGYNTKAQGTASHAEGSGTNAQGFESHAEGYNTYADGNYSHAEGTDTQASGTYSHAEGYSSRALGVSSHAEGANTYASGTRSHAEGYESQATGDSAHAEGFHTLARNTGEHACGKYNKSTQDVTLFSIGNGYTGQQGTPDTHQNAVEVDVNGNVYIMGIGNYDGTNIGASGVKSVQQVIAELSGNNS